MTQGPDRDACDLRFPGLQALRLIRREIERTRLDLTGLRVLTEAAVGYRRLTPAIAALAGADQVYAVGRDSAVASRRDAEEQTAYFAGLAHVERRLTLLPTRLQAPLRTIDVVTDLPGVRPVDESVIRNVADTAAVTLMAGVDRWRPSDTDAATCRRQGVAVAGLDEEAVGLHRFTAQGVLHALLELGVEITGSSIMVAGEARALPYVVRALTRSGGRVLVAAQATAGRIELYGGEKAGDALDDDAVVGRLSEADALVLCPAAAGTRLVGPGTRIDAVRLAAAAPHVAVVGLDAGDDLRALESAGLRCGALGGPAGIFDLLPQALITRCAAGLKVAEVMTRARRRGSSPLAAEQLAADEAHAELLPQDLRALRR